MAFAADVRGFSVKVAARTRDVFVATVLEAENSVKFGSATTGAPGQPVATGNLRGAWYSDIQGNVGVVACNAVGAMGVDTEPYAAQIEEGISARSGQPIHFRSPVGGAHSVALTVAGLGRIVEVETARLVPSA